MSDGPLEVVRCELLEHVRMGNWPERVFAAIDAAEAEWRAEREQAERERRELYAAGQELDDHRRGWERAALLLKRRCKTIGANAAALVINYATKIATERADRERERQAVREFALPLIAWCAQSTCEPERYLDSKVAELDAILGEVDE